jgi:hypothetical protein
VAYLLHKQCSQETADTILAHLTSPDVYDLLRVCKNASESRIEGPDYAVVHEKVVLYLQRGTGASRRAGSAMKKQSDLENPAGVQLNRVSLFHKKIFRDKSVLSTHKPSSYFERHLQ